MMKDFERGRGKRGQREKRDADQLSSRTETRSERSFMRTLAAMISSSGLEHRTRAKRKAGSTKAELGGTQQQGRGLDLVFGYG